jgi:DNA-binding CsgD family transcriptional regulator
MAAAVRLRLASDREQRVDAVLRPNGAVAHAEADAQPREAREALRSAAAWMDRARGPLRRRDPVEAVEIWRALVAGRWSLVDHFDHDGKRFVLARRNAPASPACGDLTPAERTVLEYIALGHTNKFVAYELGISTSGVAMHLGRAAKRLGARSRVELIAAYRARRDGQGDA